MKFTGQEYTIVMVNRRFYPVNEKKLIKVMNLGNHMKFVKKHSDGDGTDLYAFKNDFGILQHQDKIEELLDHMGFKGVDVLFSEKLIF